jgi:4-hydroxyproline epimerase
LWRQEGILGTVFEGSYRIEEGMEQQVIPSVTGSAWIIAESRLLLQENDPFRMGIQAPALVRSMALPE